MALQLDCRLQLILTEAALQSPAVQKERWCPQHSAVQPAEGVLPDVFGERRVVQVPFVGSHVEAERPGVVCELLVREEVLMIEQLFVHRPETVLRPCRLGRKGRPPGVRMLADQGEVPEDEKDNVPEP